MSSYVPQDKQKSAVSHLNKSTVTGMPAPFASDEVQAGDPHFRPAFNGSVDMHPPPVQVVAGLPPPHVNLAPPTTQSAPQDAFDDPERVRKDKHVKVERRRRDKIAESIKELAEIVPGCEETQKAQTIQLAVQYIKDHQEKEAKRMQERFLAEQTLQQLRQKMEMLEKQLGDASDDVEFWKDLGLSAGLVVEEEGSSSHMGSPVDQGWEGQN